MQSMLQIFNLQIADSPSTQKDPLPNNNLTFIDDSSSPEEEIVLFPGNVTAPTLPPLEELIRRKRQHSSYDYPHQDNNNHNDLSDHGGGGSEPTTFVDGEGNVIHDDHQSIWSSPSPCSRSCGGGVAFQELICNNQFEQ